LHQPLLLPGHWLNEETDRAEQCPAATRRPGAPGVISRPLHDWPHVFSASETQHLSTRRIPPSREALIALLTDASDAKVHP
jgi:hypothetical protein